MSLEKLRAKFETYDILDALDCLDKVRPILSDEEYRPPEIREKLLKLHGMAMDLVNHQSADEEEKLGKVLKLTNDIHKKIFACIRNLRKVKTTLVKLYALGRKTRK